MILCLTQSFTKWNFPFVVSYRFKKVADVGAFFICFCFFFLNFWLSDDGCSPYERKDWSCAAFTNIEKNKRERVSTLLTVGGTNERACRSRRKMGSRLQTTCCQVTIHGSKIPPLWAPS